MLGHGLRSPWLQLVSNLHPLLGHDCVSFFYEVRNIYSLCRVLHLPLVVGNELELLVRLPPRLVESHVGSVLEEAHLGGVSPVLGPDHDQTLQLHVAAEGDVEQQLLVGVGYDELQKERTRGELANG